MKTLLDQSAQSQELPDYLIVRRGKMTFWIHRLHAQRLLRSDDTVIRQSLSKQIQ